MTPATPRAWAQLIWRQPSREAMDDLLAQVPGRWTEMVRTHLNIMREHRRHRATTQPRHR